MAQSDTTNELKRAFTPWLLRGLALPNRFIKAATYEGLCKGGMPTPQLGHFHAVFAQNGVGLTTIAYGAVEPDGRTHEEQLLMDRSYLPALRDMVEIVHEAGGKIAIQLTHCGYFTRNRNLATNRPLSSSRSFNSYGLMSGLPFSRAMTTGEIKDKTASFARAAELSRDAGFDAIEIHMGHGYLLSQFLSPNINRRNDGYGGSLTNRLRFPLEVLDACRESCGDDFPILVKINLSDGVKSGFTTEECIAACQALGQHGVDAIVLSGGYTSKTPFYLMRGEVPWRGMIQVEPNILQKAAIGLFGPVVMKKYPFEENYFLSDATRVRNAVTVPLVYLGGVVSSGGAKEVMAGGFDAIGLGRALIHDPGFVSRIKSDRRHMSACNHCNRCMVEMDRDGVRCVL